MFDEFNGAAIPDLSKLYAFAQSGAYTVQALYGVDPMSECAVVPIKSNVIRIEWTRAPKAQRSAH